jgi:hypothetical protein
MHPVNATRFQLFERADEPVDPPFLVVQGPNRLVEIHLRLLSTRGAVLDPPHTIRLLSYNEIGTKSSFIV